MIVEAARDVAREPREGLQLLEGGLAECAERAVGGEEPFATLRSESADSLE
jgi:hypothetical protein